MVSLLACTSTSGSSEVAAPGQRATTSPRASTSAPHRHQASSAPSPTPKPSASQEHAYPNIPRADFPRHRLTPGVALAVSRVRVCVSGYASSVRDVSDADKAAVYDRYGITWVSYEHEVDHLVSLELGGSNAIQNLWPEP
jgi:5-methylcytosine-specific restriction endonuclease McrA